MSDPSASATIFPSDGDAPAPAPTREEEAPEPLSFTLQVISTEPILSFPHLPATTTVKDLKAKIRDALPSKPDHQRLIYRGRLIGRETDTMLDVFGQETLASPEPKNLHLVLPPPAPESSVPSSIPVATDPVLHNNAIPRALASSFPPRPQSTPLNPAQGMHAQQQLPGFQHVHQHHILQHHDINGQALRLQQMQRETQRLYQDIGVLEQRMRALVPPTMPNVQQPVPGNVGGLPVMYGVPQRQAPMAPLPPGFPPFQTLIHQHQRERAAQGLHGAQDTPGIPPSFSAPGSGRASPSINRPDHTTTYTREGVGPNGQRWQMTVNETTTTIPQENGHQHHPQHIHHNPHVPNPPGLMFPHGAFPQTNPQMNIHQRHIEDIQAILRNADRLNHAQNNMQGAPSNLPAAPTPPSAPTSSAIAGQRPDSSATEATPSANNNSPVASVILNPTAQVSVSTTNPMVQGQATAYILSSPSGPQALLLSDSQLYWTPRPLSRRQSPATGVIGGQDIAGAATLPEFRNRPAHRQGRRQAQQDIGPEPLNAPQANPGAANPGAGAMAAQFGPMLWLLIRLAGFVWFFTSGNTSWTRIFIISGLALLLFIANTGVFNGAAEQAWGPIRRHLEALLPLAGPDAAMVPAANAAVVPQAERPAGENEQANPNVRRRRRAPEPDPEEAAARILAQHRQNQGWLFTQIRRAEHALLLFVASLVPGVGERHIAAREAEATAAEAERQRQLEASNAEEAAANGEREGTGEGGSAEPNNADEDGAGAAEAAPLPDRLVDV